MRIPSKDTTLNVTITVGYTWANDHHWNSLRTFLNAAATDAQNRWRSNINFLKIAIVSDTDAEGDSWFEADATELRSDLHVLCVSTGKCVLNDH